MINAIEYHAHAGGVPVVLTADKNVREKNAWHLKSVKGNGTPPASVLGTASHGLAGTNYGGLAVESREVEAELYADGYSTAGLQQMLDDARRAFGVGNQDLGLLKLVDAMGRRYRIHAKLTSYEAEYAGHRTALATAVFSCPYAYFESDVLNVVALSTMEGGKEWPIDEGLERPYTFGEASGDAADQTVTVYNDGDVPAPCVFKLSGAGLTRVEIANETTGRQVVVEGVSTNGLEISTDANDLYCHAVSADGTRTDAAAYVSLLHEMSAFVLEPGPNVVRVKMTATSITAAGTRMEWRGRYSTCL